MKRLATAVLTAALLWAPAHAKNDGHVSKAIDDLLYSLQTVGVCIISNAPIHEHSVAQILINRFGDYPNFSLVEREQLDRILEEMKLTYTGILRKGIEPGKIAGVTHLLILTVVGPDAAANSLLIKLVSVESGKILATDILDYRKLKK